MSHDYKFKIDELRDNDSSKELQANYEAAGNVRNVCFVQPDGKMIFLNYAYLISGEINPEKTEIILSFTSHVIYLFGINLEMIYFDFMKNLPLHLSSTDRRYNDLQEKKGGVNKIEINKNS